MNKHNKTEEIFSENLDRILAGEEAKTGTVSDVDMLSALDFAVKMADIQPAISTQFQRRLKAGLLKKLEDREIAAVEKNRWWAGLFQQPAFKAVAAVFLVILVVSLIWRAGVFDLSPGVPQPTTTPLPTATEAATTTTTTTTTYYAVGSLLGYNVRTDKAFYQAGEKVVISLTLKNTANNVLKMEKLPPIISVMNAETHKPVYTFSGGKETHTLAFGETVQFAYTWDQTDFNGRAVSGGYYLELEDIEYQGQTLKIQQPQPVRFEIKPETTY